MNKKRVISYGILGASVVCWLYLIFFFQATRDFSGLCVNETEYQNIINMRTETEEELITSMTFNEYTAVYDGLDRCFYYSLIEGHENAYNPEIGYSGRDSKIELAIKDITISDEMIADNVAIDLLAYDREVYREYTIKCTTLPLVSVYFYEEPTEMDVDITFHLFDNRKEAQKRTLTSEGKMHIRGKTTAAYEKKGYKVTLYEDLSKANLKENKSSILGMRNDGDWMLYAGYNDQEKIRNVFSANLWYESCADNNIFGIKNGMEYRYAEAFFNGHYMGLYAIGYPVDELQLGLKNPLESDMISEFLLKKLVWVTDIETDKDYERTYESYEFQWGEEGVFTEDNREMFGKYHSLLDHAEEADIETIYDLTDIGNAIDVYLFFNLIQGVDNVHEGDTKNLYLTYKSTGEEGRFLLTPWDFDLSWGNEYNWAAPYATGQYTFDIENHVIMDKNVVDVLLRLGDENIKTFITERYEELRKGAWSEEQILRRLDAYEEEIFSSGAYNREQHRWPHAIYLENEKNLTLFKKYVTERLDLMDEFVDSIQE